MSAGGVVLPALPCSSQAALSCRARADLTAQLLLFSSLLFNFFLYSSVSGKDGTQNEVTSGAIVMAGLDDLVDCLWCLAASARGPSAIWERPWSKWIKKNTDICEFYLY